MLKLVPKPSTTYGRAFGIYCETIAIRWAKTVVDKYPDDFEEIAAKIGMKVEEEGKPFINLASILHGNDRIGFWANLHEPSGCYLVNAYLREPGILHPAPENSEILQNYGWDLVFEDD